MDNYQIQYFTNQLFGNVRSIIDQQDNPWFVGKDVAICLGYTDTDQAIRKHVDYDDKIGGGVETTGAPNQGFPITFIDSTGRQQVQYPVWINESGLYSLILSSKLPTARQFKHWVTSEVLPTMRQLGFANSMRLLQNEVNELRSTNNILTQANNYASEKMLSNSINDIEQSCIIYNFITDPYISNTSKINAFINDPLAANPELNIKDFINTFKNSNNL